MSDDLKTALELHAESDEAALGRIQDQFDVLRDVITENHKELLVAVTEMKAANASSGMKSGMLTSGVLIAAFEAIKQVFMK